MKSSKFFGDVSNRFIYLSGSTLTRMQTETRRLERVSLSTTFTLTCIGFTLLSFMDAEVGQMMVKGLHFADTNLRTPKEMKHTNSY